MTTSERVRALLLDVAPALDLAGVVQKAEAGPWLLSMRDGIAIVVELAAEDERLWLSADIAPLPATDRLRLYELILVYNAQWQQANGIRIALAAPDGQLMLAYDVAVAGLDAGRLVTILTNFRRTLDLWRDVIQGNRAVDDIPPSPLQAGYIRG